MRTIEGAPAVQEAIRFLNNQKPIANLTWSNEIWKACRDHVEDQGPKGKTSHTGTDGSSFTDRISRYGTIINPSGENLAWGSTDPKDAIIQLIIDDGTSSRGHRQNIFSTKFFKYGGFFGNHSKMDTMICQDFVKDIQAFKK